MPANDLSRLDKDTLAEVQEGTTWPVYILQPSDREGNLIVSLSRALQEKDWLVAQQMMENNEMFEAEVSSYNAGGLEVIFGKLRGFVPASHLSTLPRGLLAGRAQGAAGGLRRAEHPGQGRRGRSPPAPPDHVGAGRPSPLAARASQATAG